jgi:putative ABC transport system permease protein
VNALIHDLRFGIRMMVRNPIFTLIAVVTLALGIGANTAIFSVVDAVLLRPLPYPQADRLVFLWSTMNSQGVPIAGSALPDYHAWRDQNRVFDGLAGFYYGDVTLSTSSGAPERIQGAYITANLFQVLQVSPALGRLFIPEEEQFGRHHVVLLSDKLWQRRFGGDANILGRDIRLGGETYTVAGVMPRGMPFFDNLPEIDLWTPIAFAKDDSMATRNNHFINLVGRLKQGVTIAQAQSDVSTIARALEEVDRNNNKGLGALIVPLQEQIAGDSRTALLVLLGAVGFVLLVACVNVANLLLARASVRSKELAIRASLGASRARIIRQIIVECLPLALIGGLCGVLLATWGIDLISSLLPASLPRANAIGVNARVLGFTFAVGLLTIVIFGLLPAFQAARTDLRESMSEGGGAGFGTRKQGRLRRVLIVAEVALALVLLVGSGLMLRTFIKLRQVDVGFSARNVITMRVPLPEAKYPFPLTANDPGEPAGLAFSDQLLARLANLPGVQAATTASVFPLGAGLGWGKLLTIADRPAASIDQVPAVSFALIGNDYFRTFGIALRQGRTFNSEDKPDSQPVAIINETLAKRFFANQNPIGKTIWMGPPDNLLSPDAQTLENRAPRRTIVGVVADVKGRSLNAESPSLVYAPLTQNRREGWTNGLMLAVQTTTPPETLLRAIREQVRLIDPDLPITSVYTMDDLINRSLSGARFSLSLLASFAVLGLLLAAIGIYGVMVTAVAQRTHEIGLRMALGAQRRDVLLLVIRQGMFPVLIGVVAGLAAAIGLTRLMSTLLFEVSATDPLTLAVITVLLTIVALLACYIPARRATKVDPLVALRYE